MHKNKIKACFNKAVDSYDHNSNIQLKMGLNLLDDLKDLNLLPNVIGDLGCGTGMITKFLLEQYKDNIRFYGVDIADKLLLEAQERLAGYNISFYNEDLETFFNKQDIRSDLIFSNMALQWIDDLSLLLGKIYNNLAVRGVVAFSIPVIGTFKELNSTISFLEFEQISSFVTQSNFKIIKSKLIKIKQEFPSKILAARSIKAVGANYYTKTSTSNNLLQDRRLTDQIFNLTYNIGCFIAKK